MSFLDTLLNPVFDPLLKATGPFLSILIISLLISVVITFVYKWVTNQTLMKSLKEKQKEFQQKIKGLRDNPGEMMKVQKEAMKVNMDYMKQSFKPTLITMIPVLIIFGWMAAHLAFEPIFPGEQFSVTAEFEPGTTDYAELIVGEELQLLSDSQQKIEESVTWKLTGSPGDHILELNHADQAYTKKVHVGTDFNLAKQITPFEDSSIKLIKIDYKKLKPLGPTFTIPVIKWQPGWLGIYIIFSIVFSMGLRKILKIY